jgi:hypothetical protein
MVSGWKSAIQIFLVEKKISTKTNKQTNKTKIKPYVSRLPDSLYASLDRKLTIVI